MRAFALIAALCTVALLSSKTQADDRFKDVVVSATHVSGAVHMLQGAGGNIAASVGDDGTLIVDDQYAPLAGRIQAALNDLGGAAPKFVLNTHFHGDHTGSNAHFGEEAVIIAHDNVRVRLLGGAAPSAALPTVTFAQSMNVHFNGDLIELIHLPEGHTDGDSVVWFKGAGVLHMGDHFFNGAFPYIDISSGGSIEGYIQNQSTVLDMLPEGAKIIPGHGPLATAEDLAKTQNVIRHAYALVRDGLANNDAEDDIAGKLDAKYPAWGKGFISAARWIEIVKANQGH